MRIAILKPCPTRQGFHVGFSEDIRSDNVDTLDSYDDGVPTYQPGAPVSPTSSRQRSTPISPSTTSSTPLQGTVSSSTSSQLDPSNPYSASSSSTTDLISSASSSVESASSASPSPSASSSSSTSGMSSQSGTTVVSSGGSSPAIDGPSTPEGLEATSSAAGTSGGALPAESASAINKESDSNGALIGGIVASVLAAICAVLAGLLCRRRRRKQQSQQQMAQIAGGSMPFGSEAFQRHDRDRNQAMSLHSADPLSTVDSPSSFLPPTPAQEYASLARATTSPISPGSDFEYPASSRLTPHTICATADALEGTLMSEATGRRERPPTYISTCPRVQGTGQRPADLALYIDTSSHSLYGDLRRGKSG